MKTQVPVLEVTEHEDDEDAAGEYSAYLRLPRAAASTRAIKPKFRTVSLSSLIDYSGPMVVLDLDETGTGYRCQFLFLNSAN